MADYLDPAFRTKREPHLTADLLRQGWAGLKSRLPALQGVEDWAEARSIPAALEGAVRAAAPGEAWEVPLMGLSKAPKLAGAATALLGGMEEAEAGPLGFVGKVTGKGAKAAAKAAAEATAKAKYEDIVRGTKELKAAGLEPDIVKSMMTDKKLVTPEGKIGAETVQAAKENRARYRAEPRTLPKKPTEMSDQDWVDFGAKHGVDFSQSPMQSAGVSDLKTRREVMIPGGMEGKFTIPDLFRMKAQNFDPAALGQEKHNELMAKFLRTYERPGGGDAVDTFNDLNFSLMSPNAPLTQNEFLAQRFRLRDQPELEALAGRALPRNASKAATRELGSALDVETGSGAASRGGLGVKGTAELQHQTQLAKLLRDNPEMFKPAEGETLRDVGFRVMNQVPGLSVKTASLGVPWTDLSKANTSAVDLHMIRHGYPRLLGENPEFAARLGELKAKNPKLTEEKAAINIIGGGHPSNVYRLKTGELHPDLPDYLQPEKLSFEPKKWTRPNDYYKQIMDYVDESRGANPAHELFPEQWRKWDVYRGRVEPHEMAHPDWRKLPKQSFSELQDALTAHKQAGYMATPSKKGQLYPTDVKTQPVPKETDWRKLYYGGLAGAGTAGALSQLLRGQPEDERSY